MIWVDARQERLLLIVRNEIAVGEVSSVGLEASVSFVWSELDGVDLPVVHVPLENGVDLLDGLRVVVESVVAQSGDLDVLPHVPNVRDSLRISASRE